MTEPTDIDAHKMVLELVAGRRSGMVSRTEQRDAAGAVLDALESTAAELRQERERTALHDAEDVEFDKDLTRIKADLARAREVIDHIDTALRGDGRSVMVVVVAQGIINEYRDKQTGSGGWEPCAAMCGTEPCSPACERPTSERCAR